MGMVFLTLQCPLPDESLKKKFLDLFELARNLMAHKGFLNSEEINTGIYSIVALNLGQSFQFTSQMFL